MAGTFLRLEPFSRSNWPQAPYDRQSESSLAGLGIFDERAAFPAVTPSRQVVNVAKSASTAWPVALATIARSFSKVAHNRALSRAHRSFVVMPGPWAALDSNQ